MSDETAGPMARLTAQAAISFNVEFRELERLAQARAQALSVDMLPERGIGVYGGDLASLEHQLAVVVARSPKGQGASYPVARLARRNGVFAEVVAPAPAVDDDVAVSAQWLALRIAAEFDVTGLLTVEFTADGSLVTGVCLGPHDAGLWTMEGARTSQFSQLVRAMLDLPLGTTLTSAACTATVKVIGGDDEDLYPRLIHVMAADPGVSVHLYGVRSGPGQQIAHVTVTGDELEQVRDRAREAADYLGFVAES